MASLRVLQRVNAGVSFRVPFRDVAGPSKQRCASTSSAASSRSSYIERFNARCKNNAFLALRAVVDSSAVPRFLQKITRPLTSAPVTHVTAFLVLHEITAIAPIFGLAGLFHYTQWMPPYISEWKWFADGMRKWGNYLRKRGWLKEDEPSKRSWWTRGETGTRLVAEFVSPCRSVLDSTDR